MNTTIITAVSPEYEKFIELSLQTWKRNDQLAAMPLTLFTYGYRRPHRKFKHMWKDIRTVKWNMREYSTQRELVLSSFVLGVFEHTDTPFSLKLDGDVLVRDNEPILTPEDFKYDLVSQKWGYTKPKSFIVDVETWAEKKNIPGNSNFNLDEIRISDSNIVSSKRIISQVCLQRKQFVMECCSYLDSFRLPIPSHDTFLWYMAQRLPHVKWKRRQFKPNVFSVSRYHNFLAEWERVMS